MDKIEELKKICQLIRYDILTSTTKAGSGHPTSSLSAVELITTLFFGGFFNFQRSPNLQTDKLIFSKGHAAPLLYSLYHAAGLISYDELLTLRTLDSNLEGHPTPRFPYVEVATGSLGQGLSMGLGMALGMKLNKTKGEDTFSKRLGMSRDEVEKGTHWSKEKRIEPFVYVLLGDSEMAEGQIWEAMQIASYYKLNNLVAILDVNRLGQRGETMLGWDLDTYAKRAEGFGWNPVIIDDGHDLEKIIKTYKETIGDRESKIDVEDRELRMENDLSSNFNSQNPSSTIHHLPSSDKPTIFIAKTIKGKGVSFLENKDGWHGKTLNKEQLERALKELGEVNLKVRGRINRNNFQFSISNFQSNSNSQFSNKSNLSSSIYHLESNYSTREAYGDALCQLGMENQNIVVLDAETSNSTYANKFAKKFPKRFFEMFIAEQNMVSTALGFSKQGFIPFVSSFAAFLTRAFDQLRMSQYSFNRKADEKHGIETFLGPNFKICGSHCGVSIGADGPSQMGLEDMAMFRSILNSVVFYPSDATSTFKLTELMAQNQGLFYLRTTREKLPVIYKPDEKFKIGGSKILRQSEKSKALVIAAGITVHEALKAYDKLAKEGIEITVLDFYSVKPIDSVSLKYLTKTCKNVIVVEDHYPTGGIGEAVLLSLYGNVTTRLPDGQVKQCNNFIHLCVKKLPRSGTPEELLAYEEIDANAIIKAVKSLS